MKPVSRQVYNQVGRQVMDLLMDQICEDTT